MDEESDGLKYDRIHKEVRSKRKVKVHRQKGKGIPVAILDELELDRGVTIDPRDFEVTDELIEKIRKGEK